uniref:Uncharacterized protein n=1 Tax=Anopheles minimus TaxID=112268 RepID=A0A182WC26_9DIPT
MCCRKIGRDRDDDASELGHWPATAYCEKEDGYINILSTKFNPPCSPADPGGFQRYRTKAQVARRESVENQ